MKGADRRRETQVRSLSEGDLNVASGVVHGVEEHPVGIVGELLDQRPTTPQRRRRSLPADGRGSSSVTTARLPQSRAMRPTPRSRGVSRTKSRRRTAIGSRRI